MLAIRVARPLCTRVERTGGEITPGFGAEPSHVPWMLIMPSQGNACSGCDIWFPLGSPRAISLHQLIPQAIVWPARQISCYHDASPSLSQENLIMSTDPAFPTTAGWRPHPRYPDPAITALDPRFEQYWLKLAVERLYTGCRWSEGPVWFGDGRYLLWSDIPNNRVLKWEEEAGTVSVFSSRPTLPMATP